MPFTLINLLAAISLPIPAGAGERIDFKVNDDAGLYQQADPRIAVMADGSFAVVWVDKRSGQNDIYLQRFDTDGLPVDNNVIVSDDTAQQSQPSVTFAPDSLLLTTWLDYRRNGFPLNPDIYLQRYDDSLNPTGGNTSLTTLQTLREAPDIAVLPSGHGLVVWGDFRNGNWDIYGQLIGLNGTPVGANFRVTDLSDSAQHTPRVASSARGWFVVAWQDKRFGHNDIFVQRISSTGTRLGPSFKVNTDAGTAEQLSPDITADGSGHFTVVWVDYRASKTNPDIYSARLDSTLAFLTPNHRVNSDIPVRPQKYPAVSADRMGNVAIIWSDSIGTSWDIVGQMIDVDGVIQEPSFPASSSTTANQIKPDVALDGEYRYLVWMDTREDRYHDIYASISRYNDRTLDVTPRSLTFFMRQGGPAPDARYLYTDHVGYNQISFEVEPLAEWLTATPSASATPDSIAVSINSTALSHGSYDGSLRIIDPVAGDSSLVVSVHLDVNAAVLALSTDTVQIAVPLGYDTVLQDNINVTNSGQGTLNWTASVSAPWLALSDTSGVAPDDLEITIDGRGLAEGEHVAAVSINAGLAANSPDSVVVILDVRTDIPILSVTPDSVSITITDPADFETALTVNNMGGGNLSWSLLGIPAWLIALPATGSNNDTIQLTLNAGSLAEGVSRTTLTVSDPTAYNSQAASVITVSYLPPRVDTIVVEPALVFTDELGVTGIRMHLLNSLASLHLPFRYNAARLSIDSIAFGPDLPAFMNRYSRIEPSVGSFVIELARAFPDTAIQPGEHLLAVLYMTAGHAPVSVTIDSLNSDTLSPLAITAAGDTTIPFIQPGLITIDRPTGTEEEAAGEPPGSLALHQNYPNPFNAATVVSFDVPSTTDLRLAVYNVLGRRIAVLANGLHSPGSYRVIWDGLDQHGQEMPSGVYFYRLQSPEATLVAKMMLIK